LALSVKMGPNRRKLEGKESNSASVSVAQIWRQFLYARMHRRADPLARIKLFYEIEADRGMPPDVRRAIRQQRSKPVIEALKPWFACGSAQKDWLAQPADNRKIAAAGQLEIDFMHSGIERRITPRHRSLKTGVIALKQGSSVQCRIWDFSPAGVGLILLDADNVPAEFDLSFDYATRHCVTVWRAFNRIGLKYRSPAMSRVL
jgi:hypothetical protein